MCKIKQNFDYKISNRDVGGYVLRHHATLIC